MHRCLEDTAEASFQPFSLLWLPAFTTRVSCPSIWGYGGPGDQTRTPVTSTAPVLFFYREKGFHIYVAASFIPGPTCFLPGRMLVTVSHEKLTSGLLHVVIIPEGKWGKSYYLL